MLFHCSQNRISLFIPTEMGQSVSLKALPSPLSFTSFQHLCNISKQHRYFVHKIYLSLFGAEFEKIKSAGTILIIGGGPTGVELAAEIAVDFPEKNVKLTHRGSRLLEFVGVKASQKALDWLVSKKVEVILQQSISLHSISDGVYQTSSGETVAADCHFVCAGKRLGSSWLKDTILKNSLNIHGALMVDENMRVSGHSNIFAVGDITNVPEIKQGYLAERHAHVTVKNLKILLKGGNESRMATYKPGSQMAIISLGRKEGIAQFPFVTISGCIPGLIKSGDLFVGKTRQQLGLPPDVASSTTSS